LPTPVNVLLRAATIVCSGVFVVVRSSFILENGLNYNRVWGEIHFWLFIYIRKYDFLTYAFLRFKW